MELWRPSPVEQSPGFGAPWTLLKSKVMASDRIWALVQPMITSGRESGLIQSPSAVRREARAFQSGGASGLPGLRSPGSRSRRSKAAVSSWVALFWTRPANPARTALTAGTELSGWAGLSCRTPSRSIPELSSTSQPCRETGTA
jgi:hypothetical protein